MKKRKILKYSILSGFSYFVFMTFSGPAVTEVAYDYILGAHRGDSVEHIENTLDAIAAAVEKDEYSFLELDVQYTLDKKPVVFHDATLWRMQHRPFKVANLTYDEFQVLSDYHIPIYDEAADLVGGRKKLDVEIKSSGDPFWDNELVDYVVKDAVEDGYISDVMISSSEPEVVKYVKKTYPTVKTGQVFFVSASTYLGTDSLTEGVFEKAKETDADYILLYASNTRNFDNLINLKPEDKTIILWYFSNEIYIIKKDEGDGLW